MWAYEVASRELQEPSMSARHEQWMATFGKVYADAAEIERRFEIFKDNVEYIESFNTAGNKPYKLSVNKFADLTNEELKVARNGYRRPLQTRPMKVTSFKYENVTDVPATMDWRKKGAVTPIKDQGQCGKLYHCTKHCPPAPDFMLNTTSCLYMYKCYH
jgi:C1A family cysteine protease